jgi:hypothetical protein
MFFSVGENTIALDFVQAVSVKSGGYSSLVFFRPVRMHMAMVQFGNMWMGMGQGGMRMGVGMPVVQQWFISRM